MVKNGVVKVWDDDISETGENGGYTVPRATSTSRPVCDWRVRMPGWVVG